MISSGISKEQTRINQYPRHYGTKSRDRWRRKLVGVKLNDLTRGDQGGAGQRVKLLDKLENERLRVRVGLFPSFEFSKLSQLELKSLTNADYALHKVLSMSDSNVALPEITDKRFFGHPIATAIFFKDAR